MPGVWRIGHACAVSLCKRSLQAGECYNHDSSCRIHEQSRPKPVATRVQSFFPQSYPHVLCITGHDGEKWTAQALPARRRRACWHGRGAGIPRLSTACSACYNVQQTLLHQSVAVNFARGLGRPVDKSVAWATTAMSRSIGCGYSWRLVLDTARCGHLQCSVP